MLQGDQLGVEFGISAHTGLLVQRGALFEENMLRSDALPRLTGLYQGLVIDDFFNIATVSRTSLPWKGDEQRIEGFQGC